MFPPPPLNQIFQFSDVLPKKSTMIYCIRWTHSPKTLTNNSIILNNSAKINNKKWGKSHQPLPLSTRKWQFPYFTLYCDNIFFFLISKNVIYTNGYSMHEEYRANPEKTRRKTKKKHTLWLLVLWFLILTCYSFYCYMILWKASSNPDGWAWELWSSLSFDIMSSLPFCSLLYILIQTTTPIVWNLFWFDYEDEFDYRY